MRMDDFKERRKQMGKMKGFVEDFLFIVQNDDRYKDEDWGLNNLPTIEKMWEIMDFHKEKDYKS